jgi:hypothetical protein
MFRPSTLLTQKHIAMKKILNITTLSVLLLILVGFFISCEKEPEQEPEPCVTIITNTQIIPCIEIVALTESDSLLLNKWYTKYIAFTMDMEGLAEYLHAREGNGQFRLRFNNEFDWTINAMYNHMGGPFPPSTFRGETTCGSHVRFSSSRVFFSLTMFLENYYYSISMVRSEIQGSESDAFILIDSRDFIPPDFPFEL